MFRQSIIGLLRPNLKISDRYGHLPHLLEHLLVNQDRLERNGWPRRWHADRIIYQNAHINHDFEVEYAVVKSSQASRLLDVLKSQATNFDFLPAEIDRERTVIREELATDKTIELSLGEQFDRACLTHWPKRRRWDDRELTDALDNDRLVKFAQKLATEVCPFTIEYDRCDFGDAKLPIMERNPFQNFNGRARQLRHPKMAEGRSAVWITIEIPRSAVINPARQILNQLLRNPYFGYLPHVLRDREGLLYSLGVGTYLVTSTFEICFMYDFDQARAMARRMLDLLASEECATWIKRQFPLARRNRLMLAELDWTQPAGFVAGEINGTVMSGNRRTMKRYLEEIKNLTVDDILAARQILLKNIDKAQLIIRRHGPKVRSDWLPTSDFKK